MNKITDKQRLQFICDNLLWDGYGYWLPEWCIKERVGVDTFTPEPTLKEFRADIDQRIPIEKAHET